MIDPEGAIKAALLDVAQCGAAELAAELADVARQHAIPLPAVLVWIHDRPRPLAYTPREFLRWAERYRFTPARQTHSQIATDSPGNARTPPEHPQPA